MVHRCKYCRVEFVSGPSLGGHILFCIANPNRHVAVKFGTIRKEVLKERGRICQKCGWDKVNPVLGLCPVEVDHIDGNPNNNDRSNLQVLCPCCHSLTPTYKHFRPHTELGKKRISSVGKGKLSPWRGRVFTSGL